jgi:Uma2 family endonuclease
MEFTEPRPLRLTAEEYYRLCESEVMFGRRVQLIGGEIIEMPAQKNWHAFGVGGTEDALRAAFGPNYWVRGQMSLDLSPHSVVDPDVAVIAGARLTHTGRNNPTTALLVVEVADTTLAYDRGRKGSLYAASGIADYWIVNIPDRQLEVYRNPMADPTAPFGFRYDNPTILVAGDFVTPLALPSGRIAVADMLP